MSIQSLYSPIGYTTPVNEFLTPYFMPRIYTFPKRQVPLRFSWEIGLTNLGFGQAYPTDILPFSFQLRQSPLPLYAVQNTSHQVKNTEPASKVSSNNLTQKTTAKATVGEKPIAVEKKSSVTPQRIPITSEFLKVANKYSNCNEANNSHAKFCVNPTCKQEDPYNQEWCTDFVTYVVKESYRNKGKSSPAWFGSHDVETLKNQAISKNCFISTTNKAHKGKFIAQNIKSGDIFILNENGASHTGFVKDVYDDGTFTTIEGNRKDKVARWTYSPNYDKLSGFIRLS